jgi:hypothetical protein
MMMKRAVFVERDLFATCRADGMRCRRRYLQLAILFCGINELEGRGVAATIFVCQSSRNTGSARATCLVIGMLRAWAILADAGE